MNAKAITLKDIDAAIVKTASSGKMATDANGQLRVSGDITVSAMPVLYRSATIANAAITLPGSGSPDPLDAGRHSADGQS